jgi:glucose uptake protein
MYTPHTYPVALLMMLVSMLCWGRWANTQKIDKTWRFELYYWDYMWGLLACALLFGLTPGPHESGGFGKFLPQSRQRKHSLFG